MSSPEPTQNTNEIPEWARKELTDVRTEAATRRTQLRDVEQKLSEVTGQVQTLTNEKVAAEGRASAAELALLKFNVAIGAGVPGGDIADFVDLLQGSNEDELKASAEKVLKFYKPSAPGAQYPGYDPSAGRGGSPNANVPDTAEAQFLQWFSGIGGTPIN